MVRKILSSSNSVELISLIFLLDMAENWEFRKEIKKISLNT